jgi:hypothetical protein
LFGTSSHIPRFHQLLAASFYPIRVAPSPNLSIRNITCHPSTSRKRFCFCSPH